MGTVSMPLKTLSESRAMPCSLWNTNKHGSGGRDYGRRFEREGERTIFRRPISVGIVQTLKQTLANIVALADIQPPP
jgi:hypothetical protein